MYFSKSIMLKSVLFITMDGLTDPLGATQVIPYMEGLSDKGHTIRILSCEKPAKLALHGTTIAARLAIKGIHWDRIVYRSDFKIYSPWNNYRRLQNKAQSLVESFRPDLLHCRSYQAGIIGLIIRRKFGISFIFDMRGFWPEERVEGKIWNISNPLYRMVFNYFKKKEAEILREASAVVVLTYAAKEILSKFPYLVKVPIHVNPCCADTSKFTIKSQEESTQLRISLGISEKSFVLGYLGSVGTWYQTEEMLDFFKILSSKIPGAVFLFITPDKHEWIKSLAQKKNISVASIFTVSCPPHDVPTYLSLLKWGIFFIRPTFSKTGSSPTKLAEILSCGKPVIGNAGVGDVESIILKNKAGLVIYRFDQKHYEELARDVIAFPNNLPEYYREISVAQFDTSNGVLLYDEVYAGV